jgi:hypothetical protein
MNTLRILAITSIALAVISVNAVADTQAFKCTAEDGKISYLDTRPATGCVTIEVVRVNVGKGSSEEAAETATEGTKTADESTANVDKDIAEKKAQMKKDCDAKKTNLQTVKTKSSVQIKGDDGKLRYMTAEELVNMSRELQSYIDNFCK